MYKVLATLWLILMAVLMGLGLLYSFYMAWPKSLWLIGAFAVLSITGWAIYTVMNK